MQITHLQAEVAEKSTSIEQLRASLATTTSNLQKSTKRSQRLTREKAEARQTHSQKLKTNDSEMKKLTVDLYQARHESETKISALETTIKHLQATILKDEDVKTDLRKKVHALDMQQRRAKESLKETRTEFQSIAVWDGKKGGMYTLEARELCRHLLQAGCAGRRVSDAIKACAKAFGIKIKNLPSPRTVFRARDEGGQFAKMQTGREVTMSKGKLPELLRCR